MFASLLVSASKENQLTYAKKVVDSLINNEAFWETSEEKLDDKKPPRLDTSVTVDVLVVKVTAVVGVGETPTDILSDWIDTLSLYDVDSVDELAW